MPHPRDFIKGAMEQIEQGVKTNHFLTSSGLFHRYSKMFQPRRLGMYRSFTDHPYFQSEDFPHTYQLKTNQSASEAILLLLTDYEMTMNSTMAVLLANYLALLYCLQAIYGKEYGCKRFDDFFGSKEKTVPASRRLLLTGEDFLIGTRHGGFGKQNPTLYFQSLSFIFNKIHCEIDATRSQTTLGSVVYLQGDPDYPKRHPLGEDAFYACIVASKSPFLLTCLGSGTKGSSVMQLMDRHCQSYLKEPLRDTLLLHYPNYSLVKPKPNPAQVRLSPFYIDFHEVRLNHFLYLPMEEVIKVFEEYYQQELTFFDEVSNQELNLNYEKFVQSLIDITLDDEEEVKKLKMIAK